MPGEVSEWQKPRLPMRANVRNGLWVEFDFVHRQYAIH